MKIEIRLEPSDGRSLKRHAARFAVEPRDLAKAMVRAKLQQMDRTTPDLPLHRRVQDCDSGVIYETAAEAARALGLHATCVGLVASGKRRSTGGHQFKYVP